MKITPTTKLHTIETTEPGLDSRSIAQLSCDMIENSLIRPLQGTGPLSSDDLFTIQQAQGVISMLGEKASTLEGQPHHDSVN